MLRLREKLKLDLIFLRLIRFAHSLSSPWFRTVKICRTSVTLMFVFPLSSSVTIWLWIRCNSQFLFQKKASSTALLIYMYDICRHVGQLYISSSRLFASARLLSWINLFFACEAFLEEVVHFSLSSFWFDTTALSDEKFDILDIVDLVLRL